MMRVQCLGGKTPNERLVIDGAVIVRPVTFKGKVPDSAVYETFLREKAISLSEKLAFSKGKENQIGLIKDLNATEKLIEELAFI